MKKKNFIAIFALIVLFELVASAGMGSACRAEIGKNLKAVQCNDTTNRCIVRNGALKYGVFDKSGKQILPCVYSDIDENEYSNYLVRTKDLKMGLTNKDGAFLLKPEYLSITTSQKKGKYNIQPDWEEQYGLADMRTGHIDIPAYYELIVPLPNGAYRVEKNEKSGIINSDFKIILPLEYYFITLLPGNTYYRLQKKNGTKDLYGIADKSGNIIVPVENDWVDKNLSSYKQNVRKGSKVYIFNSQTGKLTSK